MAYDFRKILKTVLKSIFTSIVNYTLILPDILWQFATQSIVYSTSCGDMVKFDLLTSNQPLITPHSPLQKRQGDLVEFTFAKTSGTVTRDWRKIWPIADRHLPSNDPRNNCGTHFGSSPLPLSKVANRSTAQSRW